MVYRFYCMALFLSQARRHMINIFKTPVSNTLILGDLKLPEINLDLWTTTWNEKHIPYKFIECLCDNILE